MVVVSRKRRRRGRSGSKRSRLQRQRHFGWLLEGQVARCHWCLTELNEDTATLDHVVPLMLGGAKAWENTVLACEPCNIKRTAQVRYTPELRAIISVRRRYGRKVDMQKRLDLLPILKCLSRKVRKLKQELRKEYEAR